VHVRKEEKENQMKLCALGVILAAVSVAGASPFEISATGQVLFNGTNGDLAGVNSGEVVTMTLTVDSSNFVDGVPGDVRSYEIMAFDLSFSGGISTGLFGGTTAYFSLVDGFPVSDGFFVSTGTTSPGGVPLAADPYQFNLDLGYVGETLDSLDIADAVGDYGFGGLTRFGMNLWNIFPDNVVMEMDFAGMSIVPAPASMLAFGSFGILAIRRRR
jgi:hypothetical protein